MAQMECATRLLATERSLSEQEYGRAEKADFSRTILEACPELLAVSTIQAVTWSDLGTPLKVLQALQTMASTSIDAASLQSFSTPPQILRQPAKTCFLPFEAWNDEL
jgi:hypothetical protein